MLLRRFMILLLTMQSVPSPGQIVNDSTAVRRDDSFTLEAATTKVQKQFPHAVPVLLPVVPEVIERHALVYAKYGTREMRLDLFVPQKSDRSFPVLVLIHGGGWRSGDRTMDWQLARAIAREGFATATVEYRLSPEAIYPAGLHDVKAAIRWLRSRAEEFYLDTTRIAIAGSSAGGQLAALVGTTSGNAAFEGDGPCRDRESAVQSVINIDGYADFTLSGKVDADTIPGKPTSEALWLGGGFHECPEVWKEASPRTHISDRTPPIFFLNSALERYHAGRDEMVEELKRKGIRCQVHTIPNTPHPFWLFHPWFDETTRVMVEFLRETLR